MMFLTQISGTVLQSLRLSDTVGIIMEAAIIAGLFNIGGILLTYLLTKKDTLKKLDKKMDVYHAELKNSVNVKNNTLSAEHAGLSKEHTGLKEQINDKHAALEKQLSAAQTRLDHLHDESIRMEGLRKDVEKQLKQQIYNLQHPQQSWDEPER